MMLQRAACICHMLVVVVVSMRCEENLKKKRWEDVTKSDLYCRFWKDKMNRKEKKLMRNNHLHESFSFVWNKAGKFSFSFIYYQPTSRLYFSFWERKIILYRHQGGFPTCWYSSTLFLLPKFSFKGSSRSSFKKSSGQSNSYGFFLLRH